MGALGLDPALEHVEPGVLHGVEALAGDRLQPAVDPLAERVPGVGDPGLEAGAAPVLGALDDAVGAKKKAGVGPGSSPAPRAHLLPVGRADGHAVDELVAEVRVDRLAHLAVAGDVDVGGGATLERVDRVVGDGAVVDPQPLDELSAARRGEADQLDVLALGEQEGGGDRGLARGAGDDHRPARRPGPRRRAGRRSGTR